MESYLESFIRYRSIAMKPFLISVCSKWKEITFVQWLVCLWMSLKDLFFKIVDEFRMRMSKTYKKNPLKHIETTKSTRNTGVFCDSLVQILDSRFRFHRRRGLVLTVDSKHGKCWNWYKPGNSLQTNEYYIQNMIGHVLASFSEGGR